MPTNAFYVVWAPDAGAPTVRHGTLEEALSEAHRLALKHPGREFFVLEALSVSRCAPAVEVVALEPASPQF